MGVRNLIDLDMYDFICCRATKQKKTVTIRFVDFHKDITKRCSTYSLSERSVYRIFHRIAELGLIEIVMMGFGEALVKVNFLHELFSQYDEVETEASTPETSEQRNSEKNPKTGVKQQQLIQTKQICKSVGINYRLEKDWWEIASHGVEKVQSTIEVMLSQLSNPRTIIRNPCGWLKVALRDNYYLDRPSVQDSIPILETMYFHAKDKLLDLVGSLPQKIGALD